MASFLEAQLKQYGVKTKTVELGAHVMDGQNLKLPPAVLGSIGDDISKRTILIYGHYDVQPVCYPFLRPHISSLPFSVGTIIRWLGLPPIQTDQG
jgi:acetylornithine deacetylase/succinyl-diaminopimelate desuccinylase-like protein